ncbi:unnamed protein product, partial [Scytosiphon promiscuus]
ASEDPWDLPAPLELDKLPMPEVSATADAAVSEAAGTVESPGVEARGGDGVSKEQGASDGRGDGGRSAVDESAGIESSRRAEEGEEEEKEEGVDYTAPSPVRATSNGLSQQSSAEAPAPVAPAAGVASPAATTPDNSDASGNSSKATGPSGATAVPTANGSSSRPTAGSTEIARTSELSTVEEQNVSGRADAGDRGGASTAAAGLRDVGGVVSTSEGHGKEECKG